MSGIYFHIPFCKRICGYCDFHRSVRLRYMPQTVERMMCELEQESGWLSDRRVATIYFGGGTPSLLRPRVLAEFVERAGRLFDCSATEEITVEVNPDDVTPEYVAELRSTPVNRISIGVQSLDDDVLRFMGRRHDAEGARRAIGLLQDAGFDNLSADVIFGVEGFGAERLARTIEEIVGMGVCHISAYHLTLEPGTRFGRMLERGELHAVPEERSEEEYMLVHRMLTDAGFEHYEVSNYALPGRRSRHNSSYWTGAEYLGIGPGAHSYSHGVRRWCEQSVEEYAEGIVYGSERLSERDMVNECVMTSLRRIEGLSMGEVARRFGDAEAARIERAAGNFLSAGLLVRHGEGEERRYAVPPEKFLVSDAVISTLFED